MKPILRTVLFSFLLLTACGVYAGTPTISTLSPASGAIGTPVKINGTNLAGVAAISIGGKSAIVISNTASQVVALVMPGAVTGIVSLATPGGNASSPSNFTVTATLYPDIQTAKVTGTGGVGNTQQGKSVALSADGTTAIVGGYGDNTFTGAAWIYTYSNNTWTQQGQKLVGTGYSGQSYQGQSVALSADGNTAAVGGSFDNNGIGAVWIYKRSGTTWTQQGGKLLPSDYSGAAQFGTAVSLSGDGNTLIAGGQTDNSNAGAAWIFTRSGSTWTQLGTKLAGSGASGPAQQGTSVSMSADGGTAAIGGPSDNSLLGALWVFVKSGGAWIQQGSKLTANDNIGNAQQGSVALSADGNTLAVGGGGDNSGQGAVWVYTRNSGVWMQQGTKLVGTGNTGAAAQGKQVAISADGSTIVELGLQDNRGFGAAWVFNNSGGSWQQKGGKLVSNGFIGPAEGAGNSITLSANGKSMLVGAVLDNNVGAAFVYGYVPPTTINSFSQSSGPIGTLVTVLGTSLSNPTSFTIGGQQAVIVSNTGTKLVGMVMPGAVTGSIAITTAAGTDTTAGLFTVTATPHPGAQQGGKLTGTGNAGAAMQGNSVAISADGNTAIIGGSADNSGAGAAWIYIRSGGVWTQQGPKLTGTAAVGAAAQGASVAINADGNTAVVGGYNDNTGQGAVWIFTRSGTTWTQQGAKLVGTGNTGAARQGVAVAISADGNTILSGGDNDNSGVGAFWVFTRAGANWAQQGPKQYGPDNTGVANEGSALALSEDGNTAVIGGSNDNNLQGAIWVFVRNGSLWTEQGAKITVVDNLAGGASLGNSVAISANGNSIIAGGFRDNSLNGAAWVFDRTAGAWAQQVKLIGTNNTGNAKQGTSVAFSADGTTALVGGYDDNNSLGAMWVFTRSGTVWTQRYSKLIGTGATGASNQGRSIAVAATGATAILGGSADNNSHGAAWIFIVGNPLPAITAVTPASGPVGTLVTITGSNLEVPASFSIGAKPALAISNTGTQLVGMVMPGSASGAVTVTTPYGTITAPANFTVTPTLYPSLQQGAKLVGSGAAGNGQQGISAALSADGNTAIEGGDTDNGGNGAAWVFTRHGSTWSQQAKLIGASNLGAAAQGVSVAISADGNTAIVGGSSDHGGIGAAWVFTRNNGVWIGQQKLTGDNIFDLPKQGFAVAISADGNTAAIGGPTDNGNIGAVWIFTRSGNSWLQQGQKIVPAGNTGGPGFGGALALSADGKTLAVGGSQDNSNIGAVWIYVKNAGGNWFAQGAKLVGSGGVGGDVQGSAVALSADGNYLAVGAPGNDVNQGALWVFSRSGTTWTQQGEKITGVGISVVSALGASLGLSADGSTLLAGAPWQGTNNGALVAFKFTSGSWQQQGSKIAGTGESAAGKLGTSLAVSADGTTAFAGAPQDGSSAGAAWAYTIDSRQAQYIGFTPPNPVNYGAADFDPGAATTSGLPVTYTSNNGSVAIILNNQIHIVAGGNALITATQAGNATYKSATPVVQNLIVRKDTLTITANNQTRVYGTANPTFTVSYSGFINGDNASGLTAPPTVTTSATVNSNAGNYLIKAGGAVSNKYVPLYVSGTLTITKADQTINFGPIPNQLAGASYDLSGVSASSGLALTFTSSNHTVATVSGSTLTARAAGTCNITALQNGNINYNAAVGVVQPVTVMAAGLAEIAVHNAISPNGDGIDDYLVVEGIEKHPENKLTVMNRAGDVIFQKQGYINSGQVFDGREAKTGRLLPAGTYFYLLEYNVNGESVRKTGYIVLRY